MAAYKGASLVGAKGFEDYTPVIAPKASAVISAAPNFTKMASWPDPFLPSNISAKLPGGNLSSIPSMQEMTYQAFMTTPQGMGVYARQPLLDPAKVVGWDGQKKSIRSFSTDLSIIDPLGSVENVTGEFFGLQPALIGSGGSVADPLNWVGERNIGFENYPTRLMDYAFSTIPLIAAHLMGLQHETGTPKNADGQGFFPFENNGDYWASLTNWKGTGRPPTDEELQNEARVQASAVSMSPSLLIPALYERYKWGRDVMVNAMSSGNERTDYMAKKELEAVRGIIAAGTTGTVSLFKDAKGNPIGPVQFANNPLGIVQQLLGGLSQTARAGMTLIPGIGTALADTLMPVDPETEAMWAQLSPDQRRSLFSDAMMTTMMTDVVVTLPLLSGAGALASALKAGAQGGDFMAWAAASNMIKVAGSQSITEGWSVARATMNVAKQVTYDLAGMAPRATQNAIAGFGRTMLVMDRLMAAGMASMLGNWALESFVPGYAEAVGYDIDNSRPFSESAAAGVLNNIGYFSSATGGFNTMQRMVRGIPKYTGAAVGKTGLLGEQEARFFSTHFGGGQRVSEAQQVWRRPDGAAPTPAEFRTPVTSTADSLLDGSVQQMEVARVQREIIDNPTFAHLPIEERVALANEDLLNSLTNVADRKVAMAGLLNAAKSETSFVGDLMLTDAQRMSQNAVAKLGREVDDRMASQLARLYSETWWQRQFRSLGIAMTPGNAVADFKAWFRGEAARTGWQFDEAKATALWGNDVNKWKQGANLWHARDFAAVNSEVIEAAKISPVEGLLAHPEDYFLMRADHLFTDRADLLRAAISSRGTATPLMTDDELMALVAREIRTTKELDEWWSRLRNKKQPLADDLVARSEGIREGPVTPEEVDLDALLNYIEESYAILPGRHPIHTFDPLTADYPINALAERLGREKMYAVAYKPKGSVIAYRPTAREMAVRVSKNAPDGYDLAPPVAVRAALDEIANAQLHVSMNRPAVIAEGLRSRRELVEMSGDELMHHGSSAVWYQFDPALASEGSLVGHGLYLTSSHRVGVSYNYGGSQGMVKEFRIPGDARIWDAEAPMTDEFFALIDADIAKGQAGRMWKAADKARVESGDIIDPDDLLGVGGDWGAGLDSMAQLGGPSGLRESYIDTVVNGGAITEYTHQFKNAINDILFDAGYEGLTHIGGRNIGGYGEHKVYVMFDPDATLQRAETLGTGAGGSAEDAGTAVSLVVNAERAAVVEDRYRLAIRAARGEATIDEIMDHFVNARTLSTGSTEAAWRDLWDNVIRANRGGSSFDRAISDVIGQPVGAYWTPYNRDEALAVINNFYDPARNATYWTRGQEADRLAAMGDLVSILDGALEKGGALKKPMDFSTGQTYNPDGWGQYSAGITQRASQLAKLDPANVGTVRVARRMENAVIDPADIPRGPQDPTRSETMDEWITRLWRGVTEDGVPIEPQDSSFVRVTGSIYDEGMRTGTLAPDTWDAIAVKSWDDFINQPPGHYPNEQYVLEMEKGLVRSDSHGGYTPTLVEAPKAAIKRVWTLDPSDQYKLVYERGGGPLGEGDFFRVGRGPAEVRSNSNHLWVVDENAAARHAGWTDDTPQPLDNQWEQPWSGVVEDPTAGAEPIYTHVSYVRLKDGTVVQAPFRDYPMNPGDIYLGNRTLMGRKYDSIFQGVRSWRMAEHHLAQMARSFGGRYGFTSGQVELFKDRVEAYSRSTAFSPMGHVGEIKITPYANARLRDDEVNRIAKQIFGEGKVKNLVTGEMEDLDYAKMFADAHQQAWTLNFTSGIISRVKSFDHLSIGPLATIGADWLIPVLRFKASPVFRVSELLESKVFNAMRGVNVSAEERRVYAEAGLHPNPNLLAADFGADPMMESMFTAGQNRAASEGMAGVYGLDDLLAGEGTTGVAASYAIWRDADQLLTRKGMAGLKDDISDPARYKNGLMFDMQIEVVKRELPLIIKARDPRAYKVLSEELKVPDGQMARFIAEDRILYGKWQHGQATFDELLAHANKYVKADPLEAETLRAMYATEDWKVIETMMQVASLSAQAEAFGTHFFGSYRSALERSINHPLLGVYPASWMYKAAKEWGKFLYDNRTFGHGDLRLGMFPAVAMNQLIEKINMTVAMNTGESWQTWLDEGPARNLLFLWNLLLPGDWSSLPLPLARPLRSIHRAIINGQWEQLAPWNLASDTLFGPQGRGGIGIVRDINLSVRGIYDLYEYAAAPPPGEVDNLAKGLSLDGHMQAPVNWSDLVSYPDAMAPVNPPP